MTHATANELRSTLSAVADLLEAVNEPFWSEHARRARCIHEFDHLKWTVRRWFGGMGSFNDLVLSQLNGHTGTEAQLREANQRLQVMSSQIFQLSQDKDL